MPVVLILALVAVTLMMVDVRQGPTVLLRSIGQAVGGPLQAWSDSALGPLREGPLPVADTGDLARTVEDLRARNDELERERDQLLDRLSQRASPSVWRCWDAADRQVRFARVVAAAPSSFAGSTVTLDSGSADGIVIDLPVLSGSGLVGRVIAVGPSTSTVRLIDDLASEVGARFSGTLETAVVAGSGNPDVLTARLVDPLADVAAGDQLVTIGSPGGSPYPPGIPLASVSEVSGPVGSTTRQILLAPVARLTALDVVAVLVPRADGAEAER